MWVLAILIIALIGSYIWDVWQASRLPKQSRAVAHTPTMRAK